MKLDIALDTSLGGVIPMSRVAEEVGFDGLLFGDMKHDSLMAVGIAASTTSTIEVGTNIAIAFARSPMMLAVTANDLQLLSGGRVRLGLGTQIRAHIVRRFSMPWSSPVERMRDYILAVRSIWEAWDNGSPLDHQGPFYQHTLMTPMFDPGPNPYGHPKILLAGVGPRMTEAAGEVADGFICHAFTTTKYVRNVTLPALEKGRAKSTRENFTVTAGPFVATGDSDQEIEAAIDRTRGQIAFYASTPAYRGVLEEHGWGDAQTELHSLTRAGRWTEMAALIDDDMLNTFAVVAPRDKVAANLRDRWTGLADRLNVVAASETEVRGWAPVVAGLADG